MLKGIFKRKTKRHFFEITVAQDIKKLFIIAFHLLYIPRRGAVENFFEFDGVIFRVFPAQHGSDIYNFHIAQQFAGVDHFVFIMIADDGGAEILTEHLRNISVRIARLQTISSTDKLM